MNHKRLAKRSSLFSTMGFLALGIGSLAGCTSGAGSIPSSTSYDPAPQPMIESASNWQQIAADVFKQVNDTLENGGYHETSIGLESPTQQTQFTRALDGFLFTEAVNHGVSVTPRAPFTLTYNVQVLHYEPLAGDPPPVTTTGNDNWVDNETTTEMVLTISVTDGSSVRIRQSKVYYIDDADIGLYEVVKTGEDKSVSDSPLVSSNWYAANPHDVEPQARRESNSFSLMVDPAHGPIHSVNEATPIAAAHCAKVGMSEAKFDSESYPTNDRRQIKLEYECL
jgi:hypothetical protein